jgi:hypothetical protein
MTPTNALDSREYPYDPRWQIIVLNFGAGLGWLGLVRILNGRLNLFSVILGLVPVTLAFLLVIRRLAFKCHLVLDTDAILLPTGFFEFERSVFLTTKSSEFGGLDCFGLM